MWKLPTLEAKPSTPNVDTEVVAVFQQTQKKALLPKGPYNQLLSRLQKSNSPIGRHRSVQFIKFGGKRSAENVLFAGMGPLDDLSEERARASGGVAWSRLCAEKVKTVSVNLDGFAEFELPDELPLIEVINGFAEGLLLGAYTFNNHKSKQEDYHGPTRITFVTKNAALKKEVTDVLTVVRAEAESLNLTRDWSNEPSNIGTPEFFAQEAVKLAKTYGIRCKVLTEADAAKEKMGLFLGVGQGSEREGRIVVLDYLPKAGKPPKTLAFVGKGVTFDSGGISIKPSLRMEEMKHDMTGAATVMGAVLLAARLGVQNRVIGILAFTENMPSGNAIQPGNVIKSRSGKTVEIFNTDAEGRLILADVLDYAQDFKPDAVVDIATLTGAVSIALGKYCCGIMGNDSKLIHAIRDAGDASGERIWELPLFDEYFEDMKSDTADMKNSCNDGNGGTIRGAAFLKQFIKKETRWAHLDIAATAWNLSHIPYYPKRGASGAYVRTLARLAADF